MKTTTKSILVACGLMAVLASCSNDINTPGSGDKEQSKGLQFSFTEEDYGEDEVLSRAAANKAPQTETVDLGDCEAEVIVESEPAEKHPQATTRTITNRHYTIRAYQVGVKKAEIRGTFNGTNFIADADSPQDMPLKQGEAYEFIAFTDNFTPSGDKKLIITRDKVATAYMGRTNVYIDQYKKQQINFEMKHVGSRLRTQFLCQKDIPNITATLDTRLKNIIPTKETYDINDYEYTINSLGSFVAVPNNSPASTEPKFTASNGGQTFAYTSTSNYHYFLPESKNVGHIKITFNAGTIFWKPLTGVIPWFSNKLIEMKPNKSYIVKIKLKPKFTYLFNDGTTGFLSETKAPGSTKKVIGIVVGQGRAVGVYQGWAYNWDSSSNPSSVFTTTSTDFNTCMNDMKGYEYCWTTTYNRNNPTYGTGIRANSSGLQQIYEATRYNPPGFPSTPWTQAHKWYLPAYGEYKLIFEHLGFGDYSKLKNNHAPANLVFNYQAPWYGNLAQSAFTQVTGGRFALNKYYASSTETTGSLFAEPYPSETVFGWAGSGEKKFDYFYIYSNVSFIKYE